MSLDYAAVALKDCFAAGQAYVALSRARSLAGLQILDTSSSGHRVRCAANTLRVPFACKHKLKAMYWIGSQQSCSNCIEIRIWNVALQRIVVTCTNFCKVHCAAQPRSICLLWLMFLHFIL